MNRIVIIGNGFDLAHGLKTSFEDFLIDLYRTSLSNSVKGTEPLVTVDSKQQFEDDIFSMSHETGCTTRQLAKQIKSFK
ncbi:MAG: hypothetical protein ACI8SE_000205 [Bacteroidia bacterium]|jgi:hypothetical protein